MSGTLVAEGTLPNLENQKRGADALVELAAAAHHQNTILERIAIAQGASLPSVDWDAVFEIVRGGNAALNLDISTQLVDVYKDIGTDPESAASYELRFDVMDTGVIAERKDGSTHPGMVIKMHHATPKTVAFDAPEAMLYTKTGLPAGTYNITMDSEYQNAPAGSSIQFTLTKDVPAGGQICISSSNFSTSVYASARHTTAQETVAGALGTGGTALGSTPETGIPTDTLTVAIDGADCTYRLGTTGRARYGYGRYRDSAYRQWANSGELAATLADGALVGGWWSPQHDFDRPPAQATTMAGALACLPKDLVDRLVPTKVVVGLNQYDKNAEGETYDVMYDKVYLPCFEEMYCVPYVSGEGTAWEYYKELNGTESRYVKSTSHIYPEVITHAIENTNSAVIVRLRSAYWNTTSGAGVVSSTGFFNSYAASNAYRCCLACTIQ